MKCDITAQAFLRVCTLIFAKPKQLMIWIWSRTNWVRHAGCFVIHLNHKCFTRSHGCMCTWVMHTKQNWDKNHQNIPCCPSESKCSYARTEQKERRLLYQELASNEGGSRWKTERHAFKYSHLRFKTFTQTLSQRLEFSQIALPSKGSEGKRCGVYEVIVFLWQSSRLSFPHAAGTQSRWFYRTDGQQVNPN